MHAHWSTADGICFFPFFFSSLLLSLEKSCFNDNVALEKHIYLHQSIYHKHGEMSGLRSNQLVSHFFPLNPVFTTWPRNMAARVADIYTPIREILIFWQQQNVIKKGHRFWWNSILETVCIGYRALSWYKSNGHDDWPANRIDPAPKPDHARLLPRRHHQLFHYSFMRVCISSSFRIVFPLSLSCFQKTIRDDLIKC